MYNFAIYWQFKRYMKIQWKKEKKSKRGMTTDWLPVDVMVLIHYRKHKWCLSITERLHLLVLHMYSFSKLIYILIIL